MKFTFKHYLMIGAILLGLSCPLGFGLSKLVRRTDIVALLTLPGNSTPAPMVVMFPTPTPLATGTTTPTPLTTATRPLSATTAPRRMPSATATSLSTATPPPMLTVTPTLTPLKNNLDSSPLSTQPPPKGKANAATTLLQMGRVQVKQGNLTEALKSFQLAANFFEAVDDLKGQTQAWTEIGQVYELESQFIPALSSYEYALALFVKMEDAHGQAVTLCAIGHVYRSQGRATEATQTQERVLAEFGYQCEVK